MLEIRDESVRHEGSSVDRGWYSFSGGLRGDGTAARRAWRAAYVRRAVLADFLCAVAAAVVGHLGRFGPEALHPRQFILITVLLPFVWLVALTLGRSYEQRFLWVGADEFRRVFFASALLLATVGTVSWAFKLDVARGFVVLALPLATLLTLAQRYAQRQLLHRRRRHGHFQQTTLLVGHRAGVGALHEQLEREAYHGYRVVGCAVPGGRDIAAQFDGLPVLGDLDEVVDIVRGFEVDTVAVLPSPELDGPALRRLGWDLEDTRAELLLAPAVTEVAGPRVRIRPVAGLPLLHMERPELTGVRRLTKEAFDRTSAALGILFLAPVLLGLALAVKVTSSGPVFFQQERVGRDGRTFSMLKFRSMVVGADRLVDDLTEESDGNGVLFKKKDDPGSPASARSCAGTRSTSSRSSSTSSAVTCPSSVRGRRCRARSSATATTCTAGSSSSLVSRVCGRSAAARTSPGTTRCASTSATSRTGR
jgi:Bacterial sugar transferase/CoA-binding domain